MAAAYLFHLVNNYPFVDGNKRTGLAACLVFLKVDGCCVDEEGTEPAEVELERIEESRDQSWVADPLRRRAWH